MSTGTISSSQGFRFGLATDCHQLVIIAFLSLREILQNHAFCDVTKLRNTVPDCQWYGVKEIKSYFRQREDC